MNVRNNFGLDRKRGRTSILISVGVGSRTTSAKWWNCLH